MEGARNLECSTPSSPVQASLICNDLSVIVRRALMTLQESDTLGNFGLDLRTYGGRQQN